MREKTQRDGAVTGRGGPARAVDCRGVDPHDNEAALLVVGAATTAHSGPFSIRVYQSVRCVTRNAERQRPISGGRARAARPGDGIERPRRPSEKKVAGVPLAFAEGDPDPGLRPEARRAVFPGKGVDENEGVLQCR